jgi:hypothetical protein
MSLCDCRSGDLSIGRQEWRADAVRVDVDGCEPGGMYHRREVALAGAPLEDPCPWPPDAVLDPAKEAALGRHDMLQERVLPAGPQDTPDFGHDPARVGDCAQQQAGDNGIHGLIIEIDSIAGHAADLDVDAAPGRTI